MSYRLAILQSLVALAAAACINADARSAEGTDSTQVRYSAAGSVATDPIAQRQFGPATSLGNGTARTYVALDWSGSPLEVGVVMDEGAFESLPAPMKMAQSHGDGMEHLDSHAYDLVMPSRNPTPYKFVELDWNPGGHEPAGVYDVPHFDFHFYRVDKTVRDGIDPVKLGKDDFLAKSGKLPPKVEWTPSYAALSPPGTPIVAVPRMGTHWIDIYTPELQGVFGHPEAFRKFTTTFLHGSWDGQFIFDEPMVTREFILRRKAGATEAERDSVVQLAQPKRYGNAGYYPGAYRVTYDAASKEYRIALTRLMRRD
jgi:uncharacterized protein